MLNSFGNLRIQEINGWMWKYFFFKNFKMDTILNICINMNIQYNNKNLNPILGYLNDKKKNIIY